VNGWGFKRITQGTDKNWYYHPLFKANMPHLARRMRRLSVSTSNRIIEKLMGKSPSTCEVEESQEYRLNRADYQKPQVQELSQRSNIDPKFYQYSHQNKYYYNTQNSSQVLHSNGSNSNDYDYDDTHTPKSAYDRNYQHSYHDTCQFYGHDCQAWYQNSQTSTHKQEHHIIRRHETFHGSDGYEYDQCQKPNHHYDDVKRK